MFFLFLTASTSCSNDKIEKVSISDATLFELSNTTAGFTYYKNLLDTLDALGPHTQFVRIRFNAIAASALNEDRSNLKTAKFPKGSLIVKEVYSSRGANLNLYASMFKSSEDLNTGEGWIWGEYRKNGDIFYSTAKKGADCTGCHSAGGNVDLVRTFSLH